MFSSRDVNGNENRNGTHNNHKQMKNKRKTKSAHNVLTNSSGDNLLKLKLKGEHYSDPTLSKASSNTTLPLPHPSSVQSTPSTSKCKLKKRPNVQFNLSPQTQSYDIRQNIKKINTHPRNQTQTQTQLSPSASPRCHYISTPSTGTGTGRRGKALELLGLTPSSSHNTYHHNRYTTDSKLQTPSLIKKTSKAMSKSRSHDVRPMNKRQLSKTPSKSNTKTKSRSKLMNLVRGISEDSEYVNMDHDDSPGLW